jgi:cation transport regulator
LNRGLGIPPVRAIGVSKQFRYLPEHGQDIFREAFNHAWQEYAGDPRQEEIAHRVAWAAVKRIYVKVGAEWVPR